MMQGRSTEKDYLEREINLVKQLLAAQKLLFTLQEGILTGGTENDLMKRLSAGALALQEKLREILSNAYCWEMSGSTALGSSPKMPFLISPRPVAKPISWIPLPFDTPTVEPPV